MTIVQVEAYAFEAWFMRTTGGSKPRQNFVYTSGYFIQTIQSAQSLEYQCLYVSDKPRLTIHMCNGDFGELWGVGSFNHADAVDDQKMP